MHNTPEKLMIAFEILDMTCGHCRAAITRAVLGVDSTAEVEVDLAHHVVRINSAQANSAHLAEAIVAAGYTPRRVELQGDARTEPGASGCSCANSGRSCGC